MAITAGSDARVSINGNNLVGLRDASMSRSRLDLDTSTVGDDAMVHWAGLKDVSFSFSGVAEPTDAAFIDLLDACRDGDLPNVTFLHGTDGAANDEIHISSCVVTSVEITSVVDGLVEFSAEVAGNDTTNGWSKQ